MLPYLLRIWRLLPLRLRLAYLRLRYGHTAVGVAALIRDEHGRVLLVHRTYSSEEPWALPGGWLEGAESVERTLEREFFEETGLHIQAGRVLAVERAGFALVVLMHAELKSDLALAGFRPSAEVNELAWSELDDVSRLSNLNARLLHRALTV
jgi:ADP-ribose pyrophosphatase YjhB (NUDIX family)